MNNIDLPQTLAILAKLPMAETSQVMKRAHELLTQLTEEAIAQDNEAILQILAKLGYASFEEK